MKIYISGAISDIPEAQAEASFTEAENILVNQGHTVINPFKHCRTLRKLSWKEYMAICLPLLFKCDAIYMLDGWVKSRGARCEINNAIEAGMDICIDKTMWRKYKHFKTSTFSNNDLITHFYKLETV